MSDPAPQLQFRVAPHEDGWGVWRGQRVLHRSQRWDTALARAIGWAKAHAGRGTNTEVALQIAPGRWQRRAYAPVSGRNGLTLAARR